MYLEVTAGSYGPPKPACLAYWVITGMPASRLTQKSVAALTVPPGKADIFAWDTDVPGFGLKLSRGGARRWVLQYRPEGQRGAKRLTVGDVAVLSLDEARHQARKLLGQAVNGQDPHAARVAAKAENAATVGDLVRDYLAFIETRRRKGTVDLVRLHLGRHWQPLHGKPVAKVTRSDVADRLNTLARENGGVTANRCRSALGALYAWAIAGGRADSNPVTGTMKPANERPRERVLSEAELAAIWHACRDDAHGRIVKLLLLTGQRRDEVGGLTDAELDLDTGLWTLPGERVKNGNTHVIPLSPLAVDILRETPRLVGRAYIFGERDNGFSGWSRCKRRLDDRITQARNAPLPNWTLHDLRRSAATHMADILGVAPHVVETLLNHRSGVRGGIAGVYNRGRYLTECRDAVDRWAEHIAKLTAAKPDAEDSQARA